MRVGFIGVGNMGRPIALNAIRAGFAVTVHDRDPAALAPFRAAGTPIAKDVTEIASQAQIVALLVRDDAQVEAVAADVLPLMQPDSVLVVHATVKPATVQGLSERAPAQVSVVDAPISGGESGAAAGRLCYMVGGSLEAVARCRTLFATSAKEVVHLGPVGHGSAAKLVNNMIAFMNMVSAAEGFRLGARAGLAPGPLQEAIRASSGRSHAVENWFNYPAVRAAYAGGPSAWQDLLHKDLDLALELARGLEVDVPLAAATRGLLDGLWR